MSRTCIFLAVLTMAQVEAFEITCYLKAYGATQTRAEMSSHQNPFHGLRGKCRTNMNGWLMPYSRFTFATRTLP